MSKEEETRIAREAMDQKGFLPRLERLLLAVDESAVGRMAARLAGLLAGAQGMPVTMLKLEADLRAAEPRRPQSRMTGRRGGKAQKDKDEPGRPAMPSRPMPRTCAQKEMTGAQSREQNAAELKADPLAREVKAGAKKSAAKVIADEAEPDPEKVHLTARVPRGCRRPMWSRTKRARAMT